MLVHLKPTEGIAFSAVYMTGMIFPVFGMNEAGLALASKTLFLNNDAVDEIRMPFFLKLSAIHRCRTVEEAKAVLDGIPASGMGTATYLADSEKLLVQEENAIVKASRIYESGFHHTANYPSFTELVPYVKIDQLEDVAFFFAKHRHRRIGEFLNAHEGALDESLFRQMLSDHGSTQDDSLNKSVCVHPENSRGIKTCASIILSPRDRSMTVYEGNPCQDHARTFAF
jgi:hypothetical protein